MSGFDTQTGNGEFQLQFFTDNKQHYLIMQEVARRCVDDKATPYDLAGTVDLMCSDDYKNRFRAEYYQTKIRYERLKRFNTEIEAARYGRHNPFGELECKMPKHDCPDDLLLEQQRVMGNYLHLLELRAEIEGIEL